MDDAIYSSNILFNGQSCIGRTIMSSENKSAEIIETPSAHFSGTFTDVMVVCNESLQL